MLAIAGAASTSLARSQPAQPAQPVQTARANPAVPTALMPTLAPEFNLALDQAERDNRTLAFVGAKLILCAPKSATADATKPEPLALDDGVLLVKAGKIVAAGPRSSITVPADAFIIDCKQKWIMPGLVDTHSHIGGVAGADGSATIQPDVRVYDSINLSDSGFRRAAAGGLTTLNLMPGSGHLLSGQTVYIKNRAIPGSKPGSPNHIARIEDAAFKFPDGAPAGGIKMANGTNPMREPPFAGTRGKAAAMVRQSYIKAQEYQAKIASSFKDDPTKPGTKVQDREKLPPRDLGMETLVEAMTGKRIVQHHTHRSDDIMTVLRLADEFKFTVVLHHVSEAWAVASEIKAAQDAGRTLGCSVILVDSPGGKLEAAQLRMETAAVLHAAGVRVAFHTDDYITDSRFFMRMAALGVRAGLPEAEAARALTINGAIMMGLQERVGSLEPGKDADFVVLSGSPFSVYSKVERTFVEGRCIFDRADPADLLMATGGQGAGNDTAPYLCCIGSDGWAWRGQSGNNAGAANQGQ